MLSKINHKKAIKLTLYNLDKKLPSTIKSKINVEKRQDLLQLLPKKWNKVLFKDLQNFLNDSGTANSHIAESVEHTAHDTVMNIPSANETIIAQSVILSQKKKADLISDILKRGGY